MFKATREIYEALKLEEGLKVFTEDFEKSSAVWLQFAVENGGTYRIYLISQDDDNDVEVRVFELAQISEEKKPRLLKLINELNCEYRFTKFTIDEDGDLNIAYDFPVDGENPAACACELVTRFVHIIDEAYPRIMRALWVD